MKRGCLTNQRGNELPLKPEAGQTVRQTEALVHPDLRRNRSQRVAQLLHVKICARPCGRFCSGPCSRAACAASVQG
jgi:hypothetical protein